MLNQAIDEPVVGLEVEAAEVEVVKEEREVFEEVFFEWLLDRT